MRALELQAPPGVVSAKSKALAMLRPSSTVDASLRCFGRVTFSVWLGLCVVDRVGTAAARVRQQDWWERGVCWAGGEMFLAMASRTCLRASPCQASDVDGSSSRLNSCGRHEPPALLVYTASSVRSHFGSRPQTLLKSIMPPAALEVRDFQRRLCGGFASVVGKRHERKKHTSVSASTYFFMQLHP